MSSYEMNQSRIRFIDIRDTVKKLYTLMGEPDKPPPEKNSNEIRCSKIRGGVPHDRRDAGSYHKNILDDKMLSN